MSQAAAPPETFEAWMESNPLRAWRKTTGTPILQAASRIAASMTSIQLWERGVHVPSADHMASLARLTGVEDLASQWDAWHARKPSV